MRLERIKEGVGPKGQETLVVRDTVTGDHYWLSDVGYETLAFKCDVTGEVTDWREVAGDQHGGQAIGEVVEELERRLIDGSDARYDNVDRLGGPLGAALTYLDDIARGLS